MATGRGNTRRNVPMPGIGMLGLLLLCGLAASPAVLAGEEPDESPRVFLCRRGAGGSAPVAVRFAWHETAISNLANNEALPASPFHTDNWTGGTGE